MDALKASRPLPGHCSLVEFSEIVDEIGASLELESVVTSSKDFKEPDDACIPISGHTVGLILWELFQNAKKFHPEESPTLEVRISNVPKGVCIKVCDDGVTLSPEQLTNMWIPYFQAEKYHTGQVPGMGLGLSSIASLVWGVGGTCRAYNRKKGAGIAVELVLPWEEDDAETEMGE